MASRERLQGRHRDCVGDDGERAHNKQNAMQMTYGEGAAAAERGKQTK